MKNRKSFKKVMNQQLQKNAKHLEKFFILQRVSVTFYCLIEYFCQLLIIKQIVSSIYLFGNKFEFIY